MGIDMALILLLFYVVLKIREARKEARESWAALAKGMDDLRWEKGRRGQL